MKKHDYESEMFTDIKNFIDDNYTKAEIREFLHDSRDNFRQDIHDKAWADDSVTGNGCGSYTGSYESAENIYHNWDILGEALEEFGTPYTNIVEKGVEWCDVTIRFYLLDRVIEQVLDSIEEDFEQYKDKMDSIDTDQDLVDAIRNLCEEMYYDGKDIDIAIFDKDEDALYDLAVFFTLEEDSDIEDKVFEDLKRIADITD